MLLLSSGLSAYPEEFDIVVYGGTSGGITAAVQAAKMGKKVALVSPTEHLGGLSSSGLGWTDLGNPAILGGLSREFYHRVYLHYSQQPNWDSIKGMGGQGTPAFNHSTQVASIFEPKVAEQIFNDMLEENKVPVFTGLLDLDDGVIMSGQRITALKMEDGQVYRGKMFIDACYEGDVMAGAGVTWFTGREANAVYDEGNSGVQQGKGGNNITRDISAYVTPGVPSSGLLPGIESSVEPNGTGDHRLQAYCFRMCLTNRPGNRVPIPRPPGYQDSDFELVLRAVEAGQTNGFFKLDWMPNGKTDSNNTGGISTDFIGRNYGPGWNWATLNHAQRAGLAKAHENWQRGLIWTLQNHPRVIEKVGASGLYSTWGLPEDEFEDNGHWPYQLYVREARRMVSDYVMTQKNCRRTEIAPDSVGMAAYTMDSHHVQRYVDASGFVRNEGDVQDSTAGPYPISYRSIVPKVGECENLLVPWCLSSSHMAFGSIRMEPVFMGLGQSSATAAAIAIDDELSVQQVPYSKLVAKLRADGQALTWNETTDDQAIVVDNDDDNAIKTGGWASSTSVEGYEGADYLSDGNTGQGTKSVRFVPVIPVSGYYDVALRWTALDNRATNVPVKVFHAGGVQPFTVDQELNGNRWNVLGSFYFNAGSVGSLLLETTGANDFVIADAARWTPTDPINIVQVADYVPVTTRGGAVPAELIFSRNGPVDDALTVNFTTSGTVTAPEISPALPSSVTFPVNKRDVVVRLAAPSVTLPLGERFLQVTLTANAGYLLGGNHSATVTLVDPPYEAWRFARFNASQLGDSGISGPTADPDGNGAANLMDFFTGEGGPGQRPRLVVRDENLYLQFRRHPRASGLKMRVWESGDLTDWQPSPEPSVPELYESDGGFRQIGLPVRAGNALGEGPKFFQLRITE